ncbi:uncharacterized protein MONOS_157 [Monocercomonoides exilis]|uniref:uncharacterized protein n=1 Tax=Monocercomonoides exilis TaxID=2049356 RepID=UPI00355AA5B6|nr:hypothetical protein MONOS_157 [Monocercomonoides exilis]|eukprot:MONOS_157.1-p1 / transcript=MONOS_157.1 / gene=MONOS_157 / organism=Monocercomonoides_exilis_PA203 / gene_product=unspecified product / transcript_product=unspecified product / location=Mono_scaffold00003:52269-54661(+) / protein_length=707 / sequence_SO=supercontig / SO=protein_coding / is_pseudo=false
MIIDQSLIHHQLPVVFGSGSGPIICLFIAFFGCLLYATFQAGHIHRQGLKQNGVRFAFFFTIGCYLGINSLLFITPFPWGVYTFFIFADGLPRFLLNLSILLYSWWLMQTMLEQKIKLRWNNAIHSVAVIALSTLHIISLILQITNSLKSESEDRQSIGSRLSTTALLSTLLYGIIAVAMIIDCMFLFKMLKDTKDQTMRRMELLFIFGTIGVLSIYLVHIIWLILIICRKNRYFQLTEEFAGSCTSIYNEDSDFRSSCSIFSFLYMFSALFFEVLPILVLLAFYSFIDQEATVSREQYVSMNPLLKGLSKSKRKKKNSFSSRKHSHSHRRSTRIFDHMSTVQAAADLVDRSRVLYSRRISVAQAADDSRLDITVNGRRGTIHRVSVSKGRESIDGGPRTLVIRRVGRGGEHNQYVSSSTPLGKLMMLPERMAQPELALEDNGLSPFHHVTPSVPVIPTISSAQAMPGDAAKTAQNATGIENLAGAQKTLHRPSISPSSSSSSSSLSPSAPFAGHTSQTNAPTLHMSTQAVRHQTGPSQTDSSMQNGLQGRDSISFAGTSFDTTRKTSIDDLIRKRCGSTDTQQWRGALEHNGLLNLPENSEIIVEAIDESGQPFYTTLDALEQDGEYEFEFYDTEGEYIGDDGFVLETDDYVPGDEAAKQQGAFQEEEEYDEYEEEGEEYYEEYAEQGVGNILETAQQERNRLNS